MEWFNIFSVRILLPLIICGCVTFRPSVGLSSIYLIFLFISPYMPLKPSKNRSRIIYLSLLITVSVIALIFQAVSQIKTVQQTLNIKNLDVLGIVKIIKLSFWKSCQLILPDVVIFIIAIIILTLSIKFSRKRSADENLANVTVHKIIEKKTNFKSRNLIIRILKITCLITLCMSGAVCVSLINLVYFMTFLMTSTWIASNCKLGKRFCHVLKSMSILLLLHIMGLLIYQIEIIQELLPPETLTARLLGFHNLFHFNNDGIIFHNNLDIDILLQPLVLILSYLIIANMSVILMKMEKEKLQKTVENEKQRVLFIEKFPQIFINFIFRQSYIIAIFSMMIWSIIYHSWLGFVYLMLSNIIFILSNQRIRMINISPFIVGYACILILMNYVYGLNLYNSELPETDDNVNLEQIGIKKYRNYPGVHLILKSLLTLPFWIVMRQKYDPVTSNVYLNAQINNKTMSTLIKFLVKFIIFSLMWIIILLIFIMAAYEYKEMNMFRIANMLFFIIFILLFQISCVLWKKSMYTFWIALIFYTKTLLILTYIFQFDGFLELPYHKAIGLKKYKTSDLFLKLFTLIMISILSGIQLNYCHSRFLKFFELPNMTKKEEGNKSVNIETEMYEKKNVEHFIVKKILEMTGYLFLFIEIHFVKIFFISVFWTVSMQIHVVNVLIMMILTVGIMLKTERSRMIILKIVSFLSMLFIIGTMLYELAQFFISIEKETTEECRDLRCSFQARLAISKLTVWIDFQSNSSFYQKIETYFGIIVALTTFCGFKGLQKFYRLKNGKPKSTPQQIFTETSKVNAAFLIQFLIDFGYQTVGIELTFLAFFLLLFSRMDLMSILYVPFFVILVFKHRRNLQKYWIVMTCFVGIFILLQCLIIGSFIIIDLCQMTAYKRLVDFSSSVIFNITTLYRKPWILTYDFLLLFMLNCQFSAIKFAPIDKKLSNLFEYNGTNAFKTLIDILRKFMFKLQFWLILTIVFFIGTNKVMIFTLGYIAASFIFFWQGTDFYMKPKKTILKWWNSFLIFNICVILFRYAIKVFGCLCQDQLSSSGYCWILRFFDVICFEEQNSLEFCNNLKEQRSHISDIVIFFLIIFQKRIFSSVYFFDTVYDTYVTNLLSARGAQIMEEIRIQEITTAVEEEKRVLDVIKRKMEVITHLATLKNIRDGNVKSHNIAVRNGDYYMFEDDFVDETDSINDDFINSSLILFFKSQKETTKNVKIESETFSVAGNIIEKSKNITAKLSKFLLNISYKLHKLSRERTLIIKILSEERKYLKESLLLNSSNEEIYSKICNDGERNRQTFILKKIDEQFWKNINVKIYGTVKPEDINLKDSLFELFFLMLTYTDLLIYIIILINQCYYANVLSLWLPLSIFFWATLTFPRPQKSFWILLIAYTQSIILLKCISQLNIVWWDNQHVAVRILGIDSRRNFATLDLILLLALFIHRTVQKMFGIWKTEENEFTDGSYGYDETCSKTTELIKMISAEEEKAVKSSSDKIRNEISESTNKLLEDESGSKIVYRHELERKTSSDEIELKHIIKSKNELLKANEEIINDGNGNISIMITQEKSTITLFPIDTTNSSATYSTDKLVIVEHELQDPLKFYSSVVLMSLQQYSSLITSFFKFLVPKYHIPRKSVDVYTFCFLCDFINFFVLLFGFANFAIQSSDDSRSILNYFEENKVPTSLLFLIIIQFMVIMIDRMLYLRKNMLGKVIFHYIMIIVIHCWMFFILPVKTNRNFNATSPPIIFYIIKFAYFLLSAYQIRCGFPARVLGNFLMRKYNMLHLIGFKIFMIIPFLFELRTLIDWTFTPTSLTFNEWIRVETVYAQVFGIKCMREYAKEPERGIKKTWIVKLALGGGLILLIIGLIWFPLLLFAYSPSLGQSGIPNDVVFTVEIGNYEPIYKITLRRENMVRYKQEEWHRFKKFYDKYPKAHQYLEDFDEQDVVLLQMNVNASSLWNISPPNLEKVIDNLNGELPISISVTFAINELGYLRDKEALTKFTYELKDLNERRLLASILQGNDEQFLTVHKVLPKFLNIGNTGKVSVARQLNTGRYHDQESFGNIMISMQDNVVGLDWWKVLEDCNDEFHEKVLQHFPQYDCKKYMNVFMFTEKLFPSELSNWAAKGILGLYITVVIFFARLLRTTLISSGTVTIIVEELPSVDKILNLCKNIYMVREAKQYFLEEDLVAKLLFLYRSPETLIKWTKYKES